VTNDDAGRQEGFLRKRFRPHWEALEQSARDAWAAKAAEQMGIGRDHPGWCLVMTIAETLHAEQCDPKEAARIRNGRAITANNVTSAADF
jgi:hypothetical protein